MLLYFDNILVELLKFSITCCFYLILSSNFSGTSGLCGFLVSLSEVKAIFFFTTNYYNSYLLCNTEKNEWNKPKKKQNAQVGNISLKQSSRVNSRNSLFFLIHIKHQTLRILNDKFRCWILLQQLKLCEKIIFMRTLILTKMCYMVLDSD